MKKILLSFLIVCCSWGLSAQSKAEEMQVEQAVNQLVAQRTFTFLANRILSSGASQSVLKQMNTLSVNRDTLIVALPYIGRGFSSSDFNSVQNPLQFRSTDFTYKVEIDKKGEKTITMDVKSPNGNDRFTFILSIEKGIMAQLNIEGTSRSNMTFSGYLQELGNTKSDDHDH